MLNHIIDHQRLIDQELEELETWSGSSFFRANWQYLVNRKVVQEALHCPSRRLVLKLALSSRHDLVIGNKTTDLLQWLKL